MPKPAGNIMVSINSLGIALNKNYLLRVMALFLTVLCTITLSNVGEPRPLPIAIVRGVVLSFILNAAMWLCSFQMVRIKLRHVAALFIFASGFGVFIISPYGWTLAAVLLSFHLWLTFDLVMGRETV
jgi:hypothetical protein